jgi:diketogulonate reductase-like aldo/keto reductase
MTANRDQEPHMSDDWILLHGVQVPRFLYGTAWKEERTQALTEQALAEGFRGIDTANQRRHYFEEGVGLAIAATQGRGGLRRDELFLQTKFTFRGGQDQRLPYDPAAPIGKQVEQSFASSLAHLRTEVIDSYLLHGPLHRSGLTDSDWEAWRAMESCHATGQARLLGVSNFSVEQLEQLCREARVTPHFVQNRCYATTHWDQAMRRFCTARHIVYQGFSLLTANRPVLHHPAVLQMAKRLERTPSQIVFRFAIEVGMIPLTGTTDAVHMREDLAVFEFSLTEAEVAEIENLAPQ